MSGATEAEYGGHEDVEQLLLVLDVVDQEPLFEAETRVVDQQVDGVAGVLEPGLHQLELGPVGQIGGQHLHLDAVLTPQGGRDLLQALRRTRHQDEVATVGSELAGELVADSCGGAGDQGCSGGRHALQPTRRGTIRASGRA
jgi:hypothetical protein